MIRVNKTDKPTLNCVWLKHPEWHNSKESRRRLRKKLCVTTKKVSLPDTQTDRETPNKVIPMCHYAPQAPLKCILDFYCFLCIFHSQLPQYSVNRRNNAVMRLIKSGIRKRSLYHSYLQEKKGRDLIQSYDKNPYTHRNFQSDNTKTPPHNDCRPTKGLGKLCYQKDTHSL